MKKVCNFFKKGFEKNDLFKFVGLAILLTIVLTWCVASGSYNGTEFVKGEITPLGFNHVGSSFLYSISYFGYQIGFLAVIGIFYGIMSKANSYKKLVSNCARIIKGKEIASVVVISALFALFTSISTQPLIVALFAPFIISVLLNANLDKKVAFATTFGAILVGILGATYGTDSAINFNRYLESYGAEIPNINKYRFILLAVAVILYSIINILNIKAVLKNKNVNEAAEDRFAVEKLTKKNAKAWPAAVIMFILLVISVLGFIDWEKVFSITAFNDLHEKIIGLSVNDYPLIPNILGSTTAFGTWDISSIIMVILMISLVAIVGCRIKCDDVIEGIENGVKQMAKPMLLMAVAYSMFILIAWEPLISGTSMNSIISTILNSILPTKFNVARTMLGGFVSSFFVTDLGFVSYSISAVLIGTYKDVLDKVVFIFPAMYGFVQLVCPTSAILLAGLSYSNVSYKEWIKYAWKFIIAILIAIAIIAVCI